MTDLPLIAARLIAFATAMALFGTALAVEYAPRAADQAIRRGTLTGVALAALVSEALWAAFTLGRIVGGQGADASLFASMLLETGFGRAFLFEGLVAAFLVGAFVLAPTLRRAQLALAAALLGGMAFIGHAAVGQGASGAARLAGQALHLLAAGAWLGGLPALLASLGATDADAACRAARRFSNIGVAAVAIILATGAANTVFMLGMSRAFAQTSYFRLLLVKLALVAAMILVAAVNRSFLIPRIAKKPIWALRALRRNVIVELALGLGALLAVSWLGTLDPSM